MSLRAKGILLAGVHLALVLSLAGKFSWDRARLPRVWAAARTVDRNQPIRGRYLHLQLEVDLAGSGVWKSGVTLPVRLAVREDRLVADYAPVPAGLHVRVSPDERTGVLLEPLAYFVPDPVAGLPQRQATEDLWIEVSVPKAGPPRPIRLGIRRGDRVEPLAVRSPDKRG